MANIASKGVDLTTGQTRILTSADTLTDSSGTAVGGGGGAPTASDWTKNTETLSGTKTLTDSSETIQFLNPNSAVRNVVLPTLTTSTPFFIIVNTGVGTSGKLLVQNAGGQSMVTLSSGEGTRIWTDGTTAYAHDFTTTVKSPTTDGFASYTFGVRFLSTSNYATTNLPAEATAGISTLDYRTEHTMVAAGEHDRLTMHLSTASSFVYKAYKNGALFYTSGGTSSTETVQSVGSGSIAAGDQIGIQYSSGTAPQQSSFQFFVTPTSTHYSTYCWGGNANSAGNFFATCEDWAGSLSTTDNQHTQFVVTEDGTATNLAWNSLSADSTTDIKLWKNGSVSETIDLTGAVGVVTSLNTLLSAGDTISLEYDAGTNPSTGTISLGVSGTSGMHYFFGGDATTSATNYFEVQETSSATLGTSLGVTTEAVVIATSAPMVLSKRSENAVSETFELWKNGASVESFTTSGSTTSEVIPFGGNSFASADTLAIRRTSTANAGDTSLVLLYRGTF